MAKLRIVHLSDLHLFTNTDGKARKSSDRQALIRVCDLVGAVLPPVNELAVGFNVHSSTALKALVRTLQVLVDKSEEKGRPLVVLQTGDVSAFGRNPADAVTFPEWAYWLQKVAAPLRPKVVQWIDLYGNHDVWPGTWPLFSLFRARSAGRELRNHHFPDRTPRRIEIPFGCHRLDLYIVDTVCPAADANTLALGDLDTDRDAKDISADDPYANSQSFDPLDELEWLEANAPALPPNGRVIRALAMHHPPHYFEKRDSRGTVVGNKLTDGLLTRALELGDLLQHSPFELVIAGHRHGLDPATQERRPQSPLPERTLQLVCNSPTQKPALNDHEPSFCVYDIEVDDQNTAFVDRKVYVLQEFPAPSMFVSRDIATWPL